MPGLAAIGRRAAAAPGVRRTVPLPLALRVAGRLADRRWRNDGALREHATTQVALLFAKADIDVEAVARRYVLETVRREVHSYRPDVLSQLPVSGSERLRQLGTSGGLIVSFLHHGLYSGVAPSVAGHGLQVALPMHPDFSSPERAGGRAPRLRRDLLAYGRNGVRMMCAAGVYSELRDHLLADGTVAIASDMPGSGIVSFLGRQVGAATGAARLAVDTGSPIVPLHAVSKASGTELVVVEPLVAGASETWQELLQRLFDAHAPAVHAWPEAVERPIFRFRDVTGDVEAAFGPRLGRYRSFFPF